MAVDHQNMQEGKLYVYILYVLYVHIVGFFNIV